MRALPGLAPLLAALALAAVAAACSADPGALPGDASPASADATALPAPPDAAPDAFVDTTPYPIPDWPTGAPGEHGLDPDGLDQAAAAAEANGSYCLLVIRHGTLVYERYFAETTAATTHKSWSLAKSYAGTLVGIAIDRGEIAGLDEPVASYLPEWQDGPRAVITVRDLVRMTSGLEWSMFQDYVEMVVFEPDDTAFALGLPLAEPPGSRWVYHNGAVQVLEPLFRSATGLTIEDYARAHLWSRIGMTATWDKDDAGHPTPYANVRATCRDHARLGYLYLHDGRWAGQEVVSSAWVAEALTPSQELNRAYGLLFWLNGGTPALDAMSEPWPGEMVPYAPPDLYAARGFGNQFIDVIPSLDLVVVRFGEDPMTGFDLGAMTSDARFEKHDEILPPILGAVRD